MKPHTGKASSYKRRATRALLLEIFEHRCVACWADNLPLTLDHVLPRSKGGTFTQENLQPLCAPCNYAKADQPIDHRPFKPGSSDWRAAFAKALQSEAVIAARKALGEKKAAQRRRKIERVNVAVSLRPALT